MRKKKTTAAGSGPSRTPAPTKGNGKQSKALCCGSCPAAYWEEETRGREALRCSLGGIREECRKPIVYQRKTGMGYHPEMTQAPEWCHRRKAGDQVWVNG